jgi:CheY-specific phosphatase CheX
MKTVPWGFVMGDQNMWAQLDEQSVIKANSQFWEQMLAMKLEPVSGAADFSVTAGHVMGSVGLSGNWKGRIEVRLCAGLAVQATAAMLMQPAESVAEADKLDAAKEIANMIAGTIKSSLPRPCSMTVPDAVVEPEKYTAGEPATDTLLVLFRHESGDLLVRVWEQECLG